MSIVQEEDGQVTLRLGLDYPNTQSHNAYEVMDWKPQALVIMEGQKDAGRFIREKWPTTRLYIRAEIGGAAWSPPSKFTPESYARRMLELWESCPWADAIIPWNEANIEWDLFLDGKRTLGEAYSDYASWSEQFIVALRSLQPGIKAQLPGLSPGHHEDDFERYGELLRPQIPLWDELGAHVYWDGSAGTHTEWYHGTRYLPFLSLYGQETPWAITEWNASHINPDDPRFVAQAESWLRTLEHQTAHNPPRAICYYIYDTDNPGHKQWACREAGNLYALYNKVNSVPEGGTMPTAIPTVFTAVLATAAVVGQPIYVDIELSGIDGEAAVMGIVHFPPRDEQTAWATDKIIGPNRVVGPAGKTTLGFTISAHDFHYPPTTSTMPITVELFDHEIDGPNWVTDFARAEVKADLLLASAVPEPAPNPPSTPLPPASGGYSIDEIWRLVGRTDNLMAAAQEANLDIHRYIDSVKNGRPWDFPGAQSSNNLGLG